MRPRALTSFGRSILTLGVAMAAVLLGPAPARAQTPGGSGTGTTTTTSVTLAASGFIVRREVERASGEYPYWLNRDDCLKDDPENLVAPGTPGDAPERTEIQITPTLRGFNSTMNLEVWISTGPNCTDQAERREATGRCWRVYSQAPTQSGQTIVVRPKQVIAEKPSTGADPNFWDTPATCDKGTDRRNIVFYVMLIKGGSNGDAVGTSATWDKTNIDIAAAPPPTLDTVEAGDMRLFPEWTVAMGNDLEDTQGYRFYCEAVGGGGGGLGGAPNAGGLGGEGGQPSPAAACSSQPGLLREGMFVDSVKAQRCGYVTGRSARNGQAAFFLDEDGNPTTPLQNGTTYAIGVTTSDFVFNESKLSGLRCGTPREVTTFFEGYKDAGGVGGGGFCSYAPSRSQAGWVVALGLGAAWFARRSARAWGRSA